MWKKLMMFAAALAVLVAPQIAVAARYPAATPLTASKPSADVAMTHAAWGSGAGTSPGRGRGRGR